MSEPQHIREILPGVMQDIKRRMKRHRENIRAERTKKVVSATSDYFFKSQGHRQQRRQSNKAKTEKTLWA